ncbi:zinc finger MYM-type protein 1-like [Metopolophium dirhodum]|uniref:zinc finger MYM-type protein 1-like n=1 Tax=Metopolophium dirhodum TaxID=44670 RepID=UPI002990418C|nr:zinc finger MYM-type protein 1-like [Metopolophium dirhodum]
MVDNDPVRFSNTITKLSFEQKKYILCLGPCQPTTQQMPLRQFPRTNKYSFRAQWYTKTLPDGSMGFRKWLSYSISADKIFCIYCMLFGKSPKKAWTIDGTSRWKDGNHLLTSHETSTIHIAASIDATIHEHCSPLLPALEEKKKMEVQTNRVVVKQLIDISLFLAKHGLAFRGHKEKWTDSIRGNFKDMVILLAEYSPVLSSYITCLKKKGKSVTSLISWQRQNQLIDAISNSIFNSFTQKVETACVFSISIDTTFDISRQEQVSFIVRFVDESNGMIYERLLAMCSTASTKSETLFNIFLNVFNKTNLNWKKNLIGQSYDGAANMRGEYNSLQAKVKSENPHAVYIWCWAHRLNLVVEQGVASCLEAVDFFGILGRVFDFVCSSKNRVFLFEQNQKIRNPNLPVRRLKRVTTTRWSSHSTALNTVLLTWASLVDTLEDLWKSEASSDASSFLLYFQSERFLYTCFLFKKIFSVLDPLSKTFQAIDIDLITASSMITSKRGQLLNIRNEFNSIVIEVKQFIQNHLDENFTPLPQKRSRKRKIMPGEKATDEPTSDPLTNFKYHTFYTVLDIICKIKMDTNKIPCDAFEGIASIYSTFLNAEALNTEYLWLIDCFSNLEKTINLTKYLHKDEDNESTNSSDFESHISESDEELISQCPIEESQI